MGALASVGVFGYLANQLRRARERLTARNLANTGLRSVARVIDSAADAIEPDDSGNRQ